MSQNGGREEASEAVVFSQQTADFVHDGRVRRANPQDFLALRWVARQRSFVQFLNLVPLLWGNLHCRSSVQRVAMPLLPTSPALPSLEKPSGIRQFLPHLTRHRNATRRYGPGGGRA